MSDNTSKIFTINPENTGVEMPTLSSLLYKKKAVKSDGSPEKPLTPEGGLVASIEPTVLGIIPGLMKATLPPPEKTQAGGGNLTTPVLSSQWTPEGYQPIQLSDSLFLSSPSAGALEKGIRSIQERSKMIGALLLEKDSALSTTYVARRGIDLSSKASVLSGVRMEVNDFSNLWARLSKYGFIEFTPIGVTGQANVDRSAFRNALDAKNSEWVTLVRIGGPDSIEAVVIFYTEGSIQNHLPQFQSIVSASQKLAA